MSKQTLCTCDRCGKRIIRTHTFGMGDLALCTRGALDFYRDDRGNSKCGVNFYQLDLCENCLASLDDWYNEYFYVKGNPYADTV